MSDGVICDILNLKLPESTGDIFANLLEKNVTF
jgi:hypothetical protein